MADTFDPYDENDAFDAASLNTRFSTLKEKVNAVPASSNQSKTLGPNHVGSILSTADTQTRVLTPKNAVLGEVSGYAWFCDPITKQYPGYLSTAFETSANRCWQRIIDSSGGSGGAGLPSTRLELDLQGSGTSLVLGQDKLNALLIIGNVEFVSIYHRTNESSIGDPWSCSSFATLVTVIATVSSAGVRTIHWRTLRYTTPPNLSTGGRQQFSVDVSHRALIKTAGTDIATVELLAASLHDYTAATGAATGDELHTADVRFCQLTAVALQAEVN
jgi:hypothetical protein